MKILVMGVSEVMTRCVYEIYPNMQNEYRSEQNITDTTVLFVTIEKEDTIKQFEKLKLVIDTMSVVLFPFAHLSTNLAGIDKCVSLLKKISTVLKKQYMVYEAGLGWRKDLRLFNPANKDMHFYDSAEIVDLVEPALDNSIIYKLVNDLKNKPKRVEGSEIGLLTDQYKTLINSSVKLSKSRYSTFLEGAHSGQICLNPSGAKLYKDIAKFCEKLYIEHKYNPLITPHVWSENTTYVKKWFAAFPNRQFNVREQGIFRIAACLGVFKFFKTQYTSLKDLPVGYYEIGSMYRFEQKGETGANRLRTFTMTDLHVFTHSGTLYKEILSIMQLVKVGISRYIGDNYGIIIRYTNDFDQFSSIIIPYVIKTFGKVPIYEYLKTPPSYWMFKLQLVQVHDDATLQLSTIQIDANNAKTMDIKVYDTEGVYEGLIYILHVSVIGSIERLIHSIERTYELCPPRLADWRVIVYYDTTAENEPLFKEVRTNLETTNVVKFIEVEISKLNKALAKLKHYLFGYYCIVTAQDIAQNKVLLKDVSKKTKNIAFTDLIKFLQELL